MFGHEIVRDGYAFLVCEDLVVLFCPQCLDHGTGGCLIKGQRLPEEMP